MITRVRGMLPTDFVRKYSQFRMYIPVVLGNEAKNHFVLGFRLGGGQTNRSRAGWIPRKSDRGRISNRATLVKTGNLRADIKVRSAKFHRTVIGTRNIEYAIFHNEGTEKMPQREFIGDSVRLELRLKKIIERELNKIMK